MSGSLHRTFEWIGVTSRLCVHTWLPRQLCRRVLFIVHGLNEHCGRFSPVIPHFAEKNTAVVGIDLHGHGLSAGPRGITAPLWENVSDVARLMNAVHQHIPVHVPLHVMGASFGGTIALLATLLRTTALNFNDSNHDINLSEVPFVPLHDSRIRASQHPVLPASLTLQAPLITLTGDVLPPAPVIAAVRYLAALYPNMPLLRKQRALAYHEDIADTRMEEDCKDPLFYNDATRVGTAAVLLDAMEAVNCLMNTKHLEELRDWKTTFGAAVATNKTTLSSLGATKVLLQHGVSASLDLIEGAHHDLLRERPHVTAAALTTLLQFMEDAEAVTT